MENLEVTYSRVACVGTGLAAIALGATLKRWFGIDDIRFFEREETSGGTWWINTYPGLTLVPPHLNVAYLLRLRVRCPQRLIQLLFRAQPTLDEVDGF